MLLELEVGAWAAEARRDLRLGFGFRFHGVDSLFFTSFHHLNVHCEC